MRCDAALHALSWERLSRERLSRAYRGTRYEAGGLTVRLERRSAESERLLRRLDVRHAGFVTAWNPLSRRRPDGWNRRMQRAFRAACRRLPSLDGRGVGDGWSEEHLLVGADERRLVALARRFRQRAIVVLAHGRSPRLVWIR